jgi:type I restriction enzyme, S subunit
MSWTAEQLVKVIEEGETTNPTTEPDSFFNYIDVSSIDRDRLQITDIKNLLGQDAPSRARRLVREGDVIFATIRPTLKRVAIVPPELDEAVCSTGFKVLRPKTDKVLGKFLFYFMLSEQVSSEMENLQTGASYPAVNDAQVNSLSISYPPLPVQKQIVEKLDAAFADIDRAIKATQKKEKELIQLKSSLLSQQIKGKR